ncbi:TolC family protein [Saccharicrinis aurantiacus]|uniref:TolC family protein n=1 Tax=Saccharicrinis aurantiacus TaxID=1849719 RepID=UPI00094F56B8|nr:TolC family protein [Saccharicrinis aurantiacus]
MQNLRYLLTVLTIIGLNQWSTAQKTWSLSDCVNYAQEHNISMQVSENNRRIQEHRVTQAKGDFLPNLYAGSNASYNMGRSANPDNNSYFFDDNYQNSLYAQSTLAIFNGLKKQNTLRAQKYALKAGISSEQNTRNELILEVADCYYKLIISIDKENAAQEQLSLSEQQLQRIEKFLEIGKASEVERIEIKSQLSNDEYNLIIAENEVTFARSNLYRVMNYKNTDSISPIKPPFIPLQTEVAMVDSVYTLAANNLPRIKEEEARLAVAKYQVSTARGDFMPSINMQAGIQSVYTDINDDPYKTQLKNNNNQYISASLSIPIFTRLNNRSEIKIAKINKSNQQLQVEQTLQMVYRDIEQVCINYNAALRLVNAAQEKLSYASIAYQEMEKKFELGLANTTELFASQMRLLNAKNEFSQANADLAIQGMWLSYFATGDALLSI